MGDACGRLVALAVMAAIASTMTARAAAAGDSSAFFPLPMYTTVPNEGSTYGVMPVILHIDANGAPRWILAPSVSWNRAAGVTATFRYYRYPRPHCAWRVIAAASTKVNRTLWLEYSALPEQPFAVTTELLGQLRRNIFYRYFGLGPDTPKSGESSYTRLTEILAGRVGVNLPAHFNAGLRLAVRRDRPLAHAIFGLPLTQEAYPQAPGLGGGALASVGPSLRFDTRPGGDYADSGVGLEISGAYAHGLDGFDHVWTGTAEGRVLARESTFLQTAGHVFWNDETAGRALPFFYQSTLGGERLLRGFPEDRFIDRGAWEAEVEQRFRVLSTHLFGVTTDWTAAPFVAVGQVYPRFADMFSHPRVTTGVGFRAWVRPNVLGRVDLAYTREGLQAYVVIGYPY